MSPPRPQTEPNWATLPGLDLPLTGRDEAWSELAQAYRQRRSGGAILISGAPGNGKSRLMQEFATGQSSLVLVGNCHTGSQALSFQPLVQALRQALQEPAERDRLKPIWLAELSVLLPVLREQFPDLPAPLHLTPNQTQARILEAMTQVIRSLAEPSGLMLCLDDLHAADAGTLTWLDYAAGQLAESQICLLVTYRVQDEKRLAGWKRTINRTGMGSQIRLQALPTKSMEALLKLAGTTNEIASELAPRLHEATGGNAFFLLETIRELLESRGLEAQAQAVPLPQSVREAVLRRAQRLDPLARQVLDMAAVLSPLLEISLLAQSSTRSELEVAEVLDDLVLRQFLLPENGRFTFQHDLTCEAIYKAISDWRMRLLHQRVAHTLEQLPHRDGDQLAVIAAHYATAEAFGNAVTNYYQAAIQAQNINTFHVAASYLRSALELLPQVTAPPVQESDLLERLGDCMRQTGHFEDAFQYYQKALESTAGSDAITRARVLGKMAESRWPLDDIGGAIKYGQRALAKLAPSIEADGEAAWQEWINIQLGLAYVYYWKLDLPNISATLAEIEPILTRFGSDQQKSRFEYDATMAHFLRSRYRLDPKQVDKIGRQLARAQMSGQQIAVANIEFVLGFALLWNGDLAAAEKHLLASLGICEDLEVQYYQVRNLIYLQVLQRLMGNDRAVADLWSQSQEIIFRSGSSAYISISHALRSWLAFREGDRQQAVSEAKASVSFWDNYPMPFQWLARWVLLAIALADDRVDEAVAEARSMIAPHQYLQEDPVNAAMETAVAFWDEGNEAAVQEKLMHAVELAEKFRYL